MLLLSHGEELEERARIPSETAARIDLYVKLLCLKAFIVVEYSNVSVGWVQQQHQQQLEQQQLEQQQQQQQQQPEQQQRRKRTFAGDG